MYGWHSAAFLWADVLTGLLCVREAILLVIRGIKQIIETHSFREAMQYVFHVICFLNYGEDPSSAEKGFHMSALEQVLACKSIDGCVTLLESLVRAVEVSQCWISLESYSDSGFIYCRPTAQKWQHSVTTSQCSTKWRLYPCPASSPNSKP